MEIFVLRYSDSLTFKELEGFLGCLTPARRRGIERRKTEADKINTLLSRLLVLSEITARTGIPQKKIEFSFGTHGKPYLKDSELQFSLSHTKGAICAAFSDGDEIGIDIENKHRRINPELYPRVLCDEELAQVSSGEDFIRFWVQKEAFMKRLGLGISRDLRGVNTLIIPDTAALEFGEYYIGASGKNISETVSLREITTDELLDRYVKRL